ncbi:MAG TPA: EAL domain-containing protein [Thermoleophilaceae bacterium]|jgi:diguanylate cyclase (GGDEF)-like protein/PAS domain S-box-containing protein
MLAGRPGPPEILITRPTPRFRLDIAKLPYPARLAAVAGCYFAVAKLGLSFAASHQVVSAVWPPSGVALAAVLLLGYRIAPAIAVGAFFANLTADSGAAEAVGICTGNALGAMTACYLLTRARLNPDLHRMRDVAVLAILGAGVSTAVNASIGVGTLWAGGVVSTDALGEFWRTWWLGDLTGVLLVAPPLLLLRRRATGLPGGGQIAEACGLAAALVLVTSFVLNADLTLAYPVFPLIVLAAMRFRQVGAVTASLVVGGLAIAFTWNGVGPFVSAVPADGLLSAQLFVGLAALTGLLVAAMRTEWERAEEALARVGESEVALAEAQAIAHVGSWEWDIEADDITWSDELYRIFGVDRGTFGTSYQSYLDCVHPEDRELVEGKVREAFGDGTPFRFEHRIIRPSGEVRNVSSHGKIIRDSAGSARKMRGTAQDVTEHRLAEERFEALLEAAPDAMIVVDDGHRLVDVNTRMLDLFGYEREEVIGGQIIELFSEAPRPATKGKDSDAGRVGPAAATSALLARRKDGVEFPVEVSMSPLRAADRLLIAGSIRDVTERKEAERQLEHEALHDPLTGLPNRGLFLDRLEHALTRARRPQSKLAVYFCDIDDFKLVNDSLGHGVGDELLKALPPRLQQALRGADTVARFGGDEFVILCEDLDSEKTAMQIAERISDAFTAPFALGGRMHYLSVSVGLVFVEAGRATASEVLRDADAAMYRAKGGGKGRFEVFDEQMRANLVRRIQTEAGLRRAVGEDELTLRFQPVLSLAGDEVVAAEALVRWDHPERGMLPPSEFIDVAEESGLIVPLGAWVLEAACREAASWRAKGDKKKLGISINLSPRQVSDSDVVDLLRRTLDETKLDPELVELEITENVLLAEGDAVGTLRRLKELGPRLVLDDFGTGYSSLSYLKRFPIDALKIDRVFIDGLVAEPEATAIVSAMLSMAEALDVDVVAEGVERREQLEWLRDRGCPFAQGFLFSPPVEADEIEDVARRPVAGAAR